MDRIFTLCPRVPVSPSWGSALWISGLSIPHSQLCTPISCNKPYNIYLLLVLCLWISRYLHKFLKLIIRSFMRVDHSWEQKRCPLYCLWPHLRTASVMFTGTKYRQIHDAWEFSKIQSQSGVRMSILQLSKRRHWQPERTGFLLNYNLLSMQTKGHSWSSKKHKGSRNLLILFLSSSTFSPVLAHHSC